jgi:hypothetical protein
MTTTDRRTKTFSDEDVQAMLALMKGSDTVELKLTVPDEEQRSTAEPGWLPDPRALHEVLPDEALQVAAETRSFLAGRGVDLFGEQQTKTKKALESFSKELNRAP